MAARTKRLDLAWLGVASVLAFGLWAYAPTRPLMIPLVYLNTHVHELAHVLAAMASGGRAEHIKVFANGAGVAPIYGGILPIVASAGYVGASMVGGAMIAASRTEKHSRLSLQLLGGSLAVSSVVFVRGDLVGWVAGALWAAVLLVGAKKLSGEGLGFAVAFLGVQQCLTSAHALLVLYDISATTDMHSDAKIMEQATGLPDVVWAGLWILLSLGAVVAGLKVALKGGLKTS